jgi:hypothetical protein
MFTHRVQMQLKANSFILLSRKIENSIMPFLRIQRGFCDGVTSIIPDSSTATEDTYWNTEEDAEEYQQTGYLEVTKRLSEILIAEPITSIFEDSKTSLN